MRSRTAQPIALNARQHLVVQRAFATFALLIVAFMLPLCCIGHETHADGNVTITFNQPSDTARIHTNHTGHGDTGHVNSPDLELSDSGHAFLQRVSADTMHRISTDDETLVVVPHPVLDEPRSDGELPSIAARVDLPPPRAIA